MLTDSKSKKATKDAGKEPTWDLVVRRNSIERHKRERFPETTPLDIMDELPDMIAKGYEAIPEEDIVFLSWWGLMHDKPKVGTFMVRIKVPGGRIRPHRLDRARPHLPGAGQELRRADDPPGHPAPLDPPG